MGFELLLPLPSLPSSLQTSLQRRVSGPGGSFPARTWGWHLGIEVELGWHRWESVPLVVEGSIGVGSGIVDISSPVTVYTVLSNP
ncbi:hypothetical protein KY289_010581 [Solanum tuberosum]|nr:hypothetical protein KY289_010581 [Solanum tuberosum]